MRDLGVIERGYVVMNEGRIEVVGSGDAPTFNGDEIDVEGRVVMPAFTDCHTHACHAGERFAEAAMRLAGTPYLDILAAGGGIMSTVRSVREASHDELVEGIRARLRQMRTTGTAHVEIKSGYGLDSATEFKMLDAIEEVGRHDLGVISPTFLGAHAIDEIGRAHV